MHTQNVCYYELEDILSQRIHSVWVEAGFYSGLLAELNTLKGAHNEDQAAVHVLKEENAKLAHELTHAKGWFPRQIALQSGRCECTVKSKTVRCDHCGKEA
jgi:hypothetical protein